MNLVKIKFLLSIVTALLITSCSESVLPNLCTVTFDTNGGVFVESQRITVNGYVNVPVSSKIGNQLEGWYISFNNGETFDRKWDFFSDTVQFDITLYAKWNINSYTISFETNGGNIIEPLTYEFGSPLDLPKPTKKNYSFIDWFTDTSFTKKFEEISMPPENIYLFAKWNRTIIESPIKSASEGFGNSLSSTNEYLLVGSPLHSEETKGIRSGGAYLYKHNEHNDVNYSRTLFASDGSTEDAFGISVSISGNSIVIGAWNDDDKGINSGSAYIYDIDNINYERKLTAFDGKSGDKFGYSIASSGDFVVVGAYEDDDNGDSSGSAYLYKISDANFKRKITPSDGQSGDYFGYSVAIYGENIAISSRYDDDKGTDSGSVYLFKTNDPLFERKILASDGNQQDDFGMNISIYEDFIAVGAPRKEFSDQLFGSVYLYKISNPSYEQRIYSPESNIMGGFGANFGVKVSIYSNKLVITSTGLAYLFDLSDLDNYKKYNSGSDTFMNGFGSSVSINDFNIFVGAPDHNTDGAVFLIYP